MNKPFFESVPQRQQGSYYSVALTEVQSGALYASIIKHEGLK